MTQMNELHFENLCEKKIENECVTINSNLVSRTYFLKGFYLDEGIKNIVLGSIIYTCYAYSLA